MGNARLLTALAAVALAACSFGTGWISAWWLLVPGGAFLILVFVHERIDRARAAAARGIACFERALARLTHQWIGRGNTGERFRDPRHVYADDLDLFGRGSLFELLSTARTAAGERTLAAWLLAPASRETVIARQNAVAELRPRLDLREELALIGEDIRAAVDQAALASWGEAPPVVFFTGARVIALLLASAALVTFGLFLAHLASLLPFLVVVLLELGFNIAVREPQRRVLALLLERLERETFTAPRLIELQREFQSGKRPASREIRALKRLVEQLEAAGNMFFRPIAAPLLWIPQYTMAIEAWRRRHGPE